MKSERTKHHGTSLVATSGLIQNAYTITELIILVPDVWEQKPAVRMREISSYRVCSQGRQTPHHTSDTDSLSPRK